LYVGFVHKVITYPFEIIIIRFKISGYSLTETCCTGTVMDLSDLSTGTVGKPMTGLEIRLVDWEEGNYRVTDSPNPRGEIIVGGDPVAKGYLNPDGSNVETFFEEGGRKWFRTGDIGEFDQHGKKTRFSSVNLGETLNTAHTIDS